MTHLTIVPVTSTNFRAAVALTVASDQSTFIEPNAQSLAEVWYDPQFAWHPYLLLADGQAVGFAMIGAYNPAGDFIWLDRFMIDQHAQHHGLGTRFLALLKDFIARTWAVSTVVLSYSAANEVAKQFYLRHGFVPTDRRDGDDPVLACALRGGSL